MNENNMMSQSLQTTGERYMPEMHGSIELEHLHRYLLAKQLTAGKRVLDIACGEGYGTALLSESAASVVGVDISAEAVAHAQQKYQAGNLEYRAGTCSDIPLADQSVDVVVSFETIEHHDEHEAMMGEIKRVLKPGGLLVMSCPDKLEYSDKPNYSNPYHVKELYRHEFDSLMAKYFKHHSISGQRVVYGSAIFSEDSLATLKSYKLNDSAQSAIAGLSEAVYLMAFASDKPLPTIESGLLEQPIGDSDVVRAWINEIADRDAQIDGYRLQAEQFNLQLCAGKERIALLGQLVADLENNGSEAQILNLELRSAVAKCEVQLQAYKLQAEQFDAQLRVANGQLAGFTADVDALVAELIEIKSSISWRLLIPLRWCSYQNKRIRILFALLPRLLSRAGGVRSLAKYVVQVWRQDGITGVRNVARNFSQQNVSAAIEHQTAIGETELLEVEAVHDATKSDREEILFISHEASRTGAPILLLDVIRFLSERLNIDCTILLRRGGELHQEFRALGTTIVLSDPNRIDPIALSALKKRNIKLVYSSTVTNGMVQSQLEELKCPIICHVHELGFSIGRHFGEENIRRVLETTTQFFAGSKAVQEYFVNQQKLPVEQVSLAYPFITAADNVKLAQKKLRKPLDIPNDAIVVGACGMIGWRKGTDVFLQMARIVIERAQQPVYFVWIGGAISSVELQGLQYDAQQMGIDQKVIFTGAVSSHLPYFAKFDIFALPSREDPFPLVMLDAASLGIPVVCFDRSGGGPEFVEDDAGIVVPYLNVTLMAEAILKLVEDKALRGMLGKRALEKVIERHDRSVGGGKILDLIRPYLNNNSQQRTEK